METIEELINALELAVPELDASLREKFYRVHAQEDVPQLAIRIALCLKGLMDYGMDRIFW